MLLVRRTFPHVVLHRGYREIVSQQRVGELVVERACVARAKVQFSLDLCLPSAGLQTNPHDCACKLRGRFVVLINRLFNGHKIVCGHFPSKSRFRVGHYLDNKISGSWLASTFFF